MKRILQLAFACFVASVAATAGTWSGGLVDSECYGSMMRNVSQSAGHVGVDPDRALRDCAPTPETKSFAVVQHGTAVNLDPATNDKVIDFLKRTHVKAPYMIKIGGEMQGDALKVSSIKSTR